MFIKIMEKVGKDGEEEIAIRIESIDLIKPSKNGCYIFTRGHHCLHAKSSMNDTLFFIEELKKTARLRGEN